jgi:hypothetical protein
VANNTHVSPRVKNGTSAKVLRSFDLSQKPAVWFDCRGSKFIHFERAERARGGRWSQIRSASRND